MDILKGEGGVERARGLIAKAPVWDHSEADQNPIRDGVVLAADVEPKEVTWSWFPYLPRRFVTMIYGDGDVRKSWLAMAIAAGVTRGGKVTPWDERDRAPARVLYFSGEDDIEFALVHKARGTEAELLRPGD